MDSSEICARLMDYGLCLNPETAIADRRAIDEAAAHIRAQDAKIRRLEAEKIAAARFCHIISTANRYAHMMGGRFVPDPARVEAFKAAEVKLILEERNNGWRQTEAGEPSAWIYPSDLRELESEETYCTVYSVAMSSPTRGSTVPLYTHPIAEAGDGERLREALTKAMDQFLFYATSHRAKGTADGYAKAETNAAMARMCEEALTTPPQPGKD